LAGSVAIAQHLRTHTGIRADRTVQWRHNGVGPGNGTDRLPSTMREILSKILSKSLTLRGFINSAADVEATLSPENSRNTGRLDLL